MRSGTELNQFLRVFLPTLITGSDQTSIAATACYYLFYARVSFSIT